MGLSLILTTTILTTSPDLCADVYVDATGQPYTDAVGQTWSRFCEWTGPSAPVLDLEVCCDISGDDAWCSLPDGNGRCSTGSKAYCEYGEVTAANGVVCYQPFPSICEFGFCGDVLPPEGGPVEAATCCWANGACVEIETTVDIVSCGLLGGYSGYCDEGVTNDDGTITCFD